LEVGRTYTDEISRKHGNGNNLMGEMQHEKTVGKHETVKHWEQQTVAATERDYEKIT